MVTATPPQDSRTAIAPLPAVVLSSGIDAPDHLAGGVVRSFARPLAPRLSWGVVKTGTLGFISFGIWPLIEWTKRFDDMVRFERNQLWHLAEWLRLQSGNPDAAALCRDTDAIPSRRGLGFSAILWATAALTFVLVHTANHGTSLQEVIDATYGFELFPAEQTLRSAGGYAFAAWTLGLSLAYALHWLRVQLHAGDVRRFIERFNRVTEWEAVPPVATSRIGTGIRPSWIAGALVLSACSALWGVPMMLAGAAQRRYINVVGAASRAALGERVAMMLSLKRPSAPRTNTQVGPRTTCRAALCQAEVPPGAGFCPRCGTRVAALWREGI